MRDGPDDATLAGACTWRPLVSSWLGGELLADLIPINSGTLSVDTSQEVPESLTFNVPSWADGRLWTPMDPFDPLNNFGQWINLKIDVTEPVTDREWQIPFGWYLLQDSSDNPDGSIDVEAVGLRQIIEDNAFTTPQVPRVGDTFKSAIVRLMSPGLSVYFDPTLVDRALPQSFQWDSNRLDALYDIADAWPARIEQDQYGAMAFLPILAEVPDVVLTFKDGHRGTLISAPTSRTRDGIFNVYPVTGQSTDDSASAPFAYTAVVTGGPLDPATYGRVVAPVFSSPTITSAAQAQQTAVAKLRESTRRAIQRVATIPCDPRIEANDAVTLIQNRQGLQASTVTKGYVNGYEMPLVVKSTSDMMTVTVGAAMFT